MLQHRDAGSEGGGQALSSPGSCLKEFRVRPFIECRSQGTCNFFSTAISYWLSTISELEMFQKPYPQTLKVDHTSRISRCVVCRKQPQDKRVVHQLDDLLLNEQENNSTYYKSPSNS